MGMVSAKKQGKRHCLRFLVGHANLFVGIRVSSVRKHPGESVTLVHVLVMYNAVQEYALYTIRSHGTKSHMLVSKLHSGTSKTKAGQGELVRVALFWKSHCKKIRNVILFLHAWLHAREKAFGIHDHACLLLHCVTNSKSKNR